MLTAGVVESVEEEDWFLDGLGLGGFALHSFFRGDDRIGDAVMPRRAVMEGL